VGTEEDGVNEAGRATEPSLMVAPSGGYIDPDEETVETTADNEVMTSDTPDEADHSANGHADAASHPSVPLPADDIGKSKASSAGSAVSADPADAEDSPKGGVDEPDGSTSSNGRLDSVRQAMAATNSWFTSRAGLAKSDPDPEPADEAETTGRGAAYSASSGFAPRDTKPTFTPTSQETTTSPASSTPSSPSSAATGRSLWRDAYASSHSATSSPSTSSPSSAQPSGRSGSSYSPPSSSPPSSGYAGPGTGTGTSSSGSDTLPGSSGFSTDTALGGSGASLGGGGGSAASQSAYASSVTAAWQRNTGTKRKRETSVRRSTRRQAQLTLARVEPWSVMKFSFVASVVAFIILFVAVAVLYMVLSALGVFTSLQHTVTTITSSQGSSGTNISAWFSASRILGYTGMLGALNIVLITAMSTIGAVIYNLIARTIGGIEVTLRETD
jgi:hypothetical protein